MSNPFKLYEGKENKFSREMRKLWRDFGIDLSELQVKHRKDGANDTESREAVCEWVKKHSGDLF